MHDLKLYKSIRFKDHERDRPNFIFSSDIPQKAKLIAVRCIREDWSSGRDISVKDMSFVVNVELNTLLSRNRKLRPSVLLKENALFVAKITGSKLQKAHTPAANERRHPIISIDGKVHTPYDINCNDVFIASLNLVTTSIKVRKGSPVVIDFEVDANYKLLTLTDDSLLVQLASYASNRIQHELEKRNRGPGPGKSILKRDYDERYYLDSSSVTSEDTINCLQEKSTNRVWFEDDFSDFQDSDVSLVLEISSSGDDLGASTNLADTAEDQHSKSFIADITNLRHNDEETTVNSDSENHKEVPNSKSKESIVDLNGVENNAPLAEALDVVNTEAVLIADNIVPDNLQEIDGRKISEKDSKVNVPTLVGTVDFDLNGNLLRADISSLSLKEFMENNSTGNTLLENGITQKMNAEIQNTKSQGTMAEYFSNNSPSSAKLDGIKLNLNKENIPPQNAKGNNSINGYTEEKLEEAPKLIRSATESLPGTDITHNGLESNYIPPMALSTNSNSESSEEPEPFIPSPGKRMYYNNSPPKTAQPASRVAGSIAMFSVEHQNGMDFAFKSSNVPTYIKEDKKFRFIKVGKVQTYVHLFEEKVNETSESKLANASRANSRTGSPRSKAALDN